jgi:hypothetical protein
VKVNTTWLVVLLVLARAVVALALAAGPWTDQPTELDGWDVARFQAMADAPGRHYLDHAVEYPPGSVVIIEALAVSDVVTTHRLLVAGGLVVDLGIAAALAHWWRRPVALAYLALGLPLLPMGYVRLDLWAAAAAVAGGVALARRRPVLFGSAVTVGAMIKLWPVLLVAPALALGRRREAGWATGSLAVAGLVWLACAGWSLDPVDQVISLRGATGWHVESVGGSLTALVTGAEPELQLDAFRIGVLDGRLVLVGRVITAAAVAALVVAGRRATAGAGTSDTPPELAAVIMLGSVAALIITAPLLSPQFLLWLTPWAAVLIGNQVAGGGPTVDRWPAAATTGAVLITAATLAAFGPPHLHHPVAATALLVRDGLLVAVVAGCVVALAGRSDRAEDPLGNGGPGPGPAGPETGVDQVPEVPGSLAG